MVAARAPGLQYSGVERLELIRSVSVQLVVGRRNIRLGGVHHDMPVLWRLRQGTLRGQNPLIELNQSLRQRASCTHIAVYVDHAPASLDVS